MQKHHFLILICLTLVGFIHTSSSEEEFQEEGSANEPQITSSKDNLLIGSKDIKESNTRFNCLTHALKVALLKTCKVEDQTSFFVNTLNNQEALIAEGSDGKVFKMTRPSDGKTVAVKKRSQKDSHSRKEFFREVRLMMKFRGEGITADLDCMFEDDDGFLYFMMEYLPGHPLDEVQFYHPQSDNFNVRWGELCLKMATILSKLHEKNVVHLDLHLCNWIVSEDGRLYIIDFSRARKTGFFQSATSCPLPETANQNYRSYSKQSDAWLLGQLFEEIYENMILSLCGFLDIPANPSSITDAKKLIPRTLVDFGGIDAIVSNLLMAEPGFRPSVPEAISLLETFLKRHKASV